MPFEYGVAVVVLLISAVVVAAVVIDSFERLARWVRSAVPIAGPALASGLRAVEGAVITIARDVVNTIVGYLNTTSGWIHWIGQEISGITGGTTVDLSGVYAAIGTLQRSLDALSNFTHNVVANDVNRLWHYFYMLNAIVLQEIRPAIRALQNAVTAIQHQVATVIMPLFHSIAYDVIPLQLKGIIAIQRILIMNLANITHLVTGPLVQQLEWATYLTTVALPNVLTRIKRLEFVSNELEPLVATGPLTQTESENLRKLGNDLCYCLTQGSGQTIDPAILYMVIDEM